LPVLLPLCSYINGSCKHLVVLKYCIGVRNIATCFSQCLFLLFAFKFYEQYDDVEIGALDNAELEGTIQVDSNRLQEVLNDYYKEKAEKYDNCSPIAAWFSYSQRLWWRGVHIVKVCH
jgi:hypothetical protein